MKEYLMSLIICSIFASVVCACTPDDGLSKIRKFLVGLCIICISLKPCVGVIEFIKEFDIKLYLSEISAENRDEEWENYLEKYGEKSVKTYIEYELCETFGVSATEISVNFCNDGDDFGVDGNEGSGENMAVKKIYILLDKSAVFKDTAKIQTYFEKVFDCDVIVAID